MYGSAVVITGFAFSGWALEKRTVRRKVGDRRQPVIDNLSIVRDRDGGRNATNVTVTTLSEIGV